MSRVVFRGRLRDTLHAVRRPTRHVLAQLGEVARHKRAVPSGVLRLRGDCLRRGSRHRAIRRRGIVNELLRGAAYDGRPRRA